jgi:hypothetical protein
MDLVMRDRTPFLKAPVTRWVERKFLGYEESAEQQEERVGVAIRDLTRLDEFSVRVPEVLANEVDAEWVEISPAVRPDAGQVFDVPGAGLKLSLGPRRHRRQYMSRQQRIARTAALQLAAHHHQLAQLELKELTARAQVHALQAQINPHFLFNTLNVLASLIHSDPQKAEMVTEELADVFRYALESTRQEWVTLDDELHFLEAYLGIKKARFDERLRFSFDVDPSLRSMKIPPMILQPLVENAVKHGSVLSRKEERSASARSWDPIESSLQLKIREPNVARLYEAGVLESVSLMYASDWIISTARQEVFSWKKSSQKVCVPFWSCRSSPECTREAARAHCGRRT